MATAVTPKSHRWKVSHGLGKTANRARLISAKIASGRFDPGGLSGGDTRVAGLMVFTGLPSQPGYAPGAAGGFIAGFAFKAEGLCAGWIGE